MKLNLPTYNYCIKNKHNQPYIFDFIRKKFYRLTPEEWVRQHLLHYLVTHCHYPKGRIAVEQLVPINKMNKRADIVIYDADGKVFMVVECKRSSEQLTQNVFDQIARYCLQLEAQYLMLSNGLQHFYGRIVPTQQAYQLLPKIPEYPEL